MKQYFFVVPSRMCSYIILMATNKVIDYQQTNIILKYFLEFTLAGSNAALLLANDL